MQEAEVVLDNPYWDAVGDHAGPGLFGGREIGSLLDNAESWIEKRWEYVARYSWTVTDPETVGFVAAHTDGQMVDPMAGTGYWGYILGQVGVDVVCYDLEPETNRWHEGEKLHVPMTQMDGAQAAALHPDRTLLLAWPPYSQDDGKRVLAAYKGDRVIYLGETDGCCGDEDLHELFDKDWNPVAAHRPVQWCGLHDVVIVYDRKAT